MAASCIVRETQMGRRRHC